MSLIGWIKGLFGKSPNRAPSEADQKLATEWYERKSKMLEQILGREHDMVMHAIIPFAIGGGLDLYYYPHGVPGTAIATKELSDLPGQGASNKVYRSYELAMFTRHPLAMDDAKNDETPFGRAHSNINAILNYIARYALQAKLNPTETCEFPADMENVGGKCLIFDGYGNGAGATDGFGVLAVIEIFRSEMDHARKNGGADLIQRLKARGHYPYSDLDRKPVV